MRALHDILGGPHHEDHMPCSVEPDLVCSLGGGIFGSSVYVGELLCGNASYATLQHDASWRWPMAMCGVAVFAVSVAVLLLIKEPPVGKFTNQRKVWGLCGYC